jgi:hypothetical protein
MSCCYSGPPKKRNRPPTHEYKPLEPEIPIEKLDAKKKNYHEADDPEIRLRKVEVRIKKENFIPPPRGIDVNITM